MLFSNVHAIPNKKDIKYNLKMYILQLKISIEHDNFDWYTNQRNSKLH